ncbi:MAG TPA: hypothetical protein VGK45_18885 [Thermoanaerobaculia bacterium]|jgi:hypothetical protein
MPWTPEIRTGLVHKAVSSLLAAAEGVHRLGAGKESLAYLDTALDFIRALPTEAKRDKRDLFREVERAVTLLAPLRLRLKF